MDSLIVFDLAFKRMTPSLELVSLPGQMRRLIAYHPRKIKEAQVGRPVHLRTLPPHGVVITQC